MKTFLRVFLAISLSCCAGMEAQVTEGSLNGVVTDPSGAALSGAAIKVLNEATGVVREGSTNKNGEYRVGFLQPGPYTVVVTHEGFGEGKVTHVQIDPGLTARGDVHLLVGQVSSAVDVTDSASLVDTEEGRLTTTMTRQQVQELPLYGRDVYSLALLQPGVTATLAPMISNTQSNTFNSGFSANGATPRGNNFVVDGVSNNNEWLGGAPAISPSPEGIESFQVQTANFSAEYGRNNGAIVITNTRAGGNEFHGSIYDYVRNPVFDASNAFDLKLAGKTNIHRNDFGVSFGGPLHKGKTFFFFNYEGVQEADSQTIIGTGETPEFREQVATYRPTSIANTQFTLFPSGPCVPGTSVDTGSIYGKTSSLASVQADPTVAQFYDGGPDGIVDTCETASVYKRPLTSNQYMARVDHHFSDKDSFFARFIQDTHSTDTAADELSGAAARGFKAPLHGTFPSLLLSEIHVFSPKVLNDFRFQYARSDFGIGFQAPNAGAATNNYPYLYFDDSTTPFGGTALLPREFVFNNFTFEDTVAVQLGTHSLKVGAEVQHVAENSNYHSEDNSFYEFQDQFTFANDGAYYQEAAVNPVTGQFASTPRHFRQTWFAAFAEDDWKVTKRLMLNLGLRYDLYGVATEKNGILSNITLANNSTLAAQIGDASVGRVKTLYDGDHNNFSPRVGFAYDLTGTGKTALRGSISQAYLAPYSNLYTNASRFDSPDVAFPFVFPYYYGGTITYGVPGLLNPAYQTGITSTGGIAGTLISPSGVQRKMRTAYSNQYFLGIQQELPLKYFFTANYVGTTAKKLYIRDDINRYSGSRTDNGDVADRYNGEWGSTTFVKNGSGSNYNGLNVQLQHPLDKHYALTVNYTFSKSLDTVSDPGLADFANVSVQQYIGTMDELHPRLDYGPSDFDARHHFTANGSFMIPGPVKNAMLRNTLGGWQLNGVLSLQSGRPFSVACTNSLYCDYNGDGDKYDRPNAPSYGNTKRGLSRSDYQKGMLNSSDFLDPNNGLTYAEEFGTLSGLAEGKNGNLGRNTFRGPGYASVDASVFKTFALPQKMHLQFRGEAFNLFNRVNLYLPNSSLSSSLFGKSTEAFPARSLQIAMKLLF